MSDEWVMVPRKADVNMLAAGERAMSRLHWERFTEAVWDEMLDAAPKPQEQAEPVAQIGWADEFGNLFPMGAWKPTQRTHHDSHKTAWRAVYLHPPAAEVQEQAEPVVWVRPDQLKQATQGRFLCTLGSKQLAGDMVPLYLHPPASEVQLQGGLDNEELLEAWRTKVPGVEPTDSDLRAFALGVEFGTRGKRAYFDERNSARDAWRRRVKRCETLEAEVQRLRDALKPFAAIDLTTNQAVDGMDVLRARRALEGGE